MNKVTCFISITINYLTYAYNQAISAWIYGFIDVRPSVLEWTDGLKYVLN